MAKQPLDNDRNLLQELIRLKKEYQSLDQNIGKSKKSALVDEVQQAKGLLDKNRELQKSLKNQIALEIKRSAKANAVDRNKLLQRAITYQKELNNLQKTGVKLEEDYAKVQEDVIDNLKEKYSEGGNLLLSWHKTLKTLVTDFRTMYNNARLTATLLAGDMLNRSIKLASTIYDVKEAMGLTWTQTIEVGKAITEAGIKGIWLGYGFGHAAEVAGELIKLTGDLNMITGETVSKLAYMSHHFGLSGAEAAQLFEISRQISDTTATGALNTMEMFEGVARTKGVPLQRFMSDIAGSSEEIATFWAGNPEKVAETAAEAARLGIKLSDVAAITRAMLDMESAFTNQFELTALTGKQYNFEKAKSLMMQNDEIGGIKLMLKELGGISAWNNMTYIERDKVSKLMGRDAATIQQMLVDQQRELKASSEHKTVMEQILGYGVRIVKTMKENWQTTILLLANLKNIGGSMQWIWGGAKKLFLWLGKSAALVGKGIGGLFGLGGKEKKMAVPEPGGKVSKAAAAGKRGRPRTSGTEKFFKMFDKIKPASILKFAAVSAILIGALIGLAFALKQWDSVNWEGALLGMTTLLAMVLMMRLLGQTVGKALPYIALAALGIAILSGALYVAGLALQQVMAAGDPSDVLSMAGSLLALGGSMIVLAIGSAGMIFGSIGLFLLAASLVALGGAFALAIPGMLLMPAFTQSLLQLVNASAGIFSLSGALLTLSLSIISLSTSLMMLAPLLPVLSIASSLGLAGGETESKDNEGVEAKLDELIALIKQGGVIQMDGAVVGKYVQKYLKMNERSPGIG